MQLIVYNTVRWSTEVVFTSIVFPPPDVRFSAEMNVALRIWRAVKPEPPQVL
jgi:hypothetical protein